MLFPLKLINQYLLNNNFLKFRVTYQPSFSESDREIVLRLVENFVEDFIKLILIANSTKKRK